MAADKQKFLDDLGRLGIDEDTARKAMMNCGDAMIAQGAKYAFGVGAMGALLGLRAGVGGSVGGGMIGFVSGAAHGLNTAIDSPSCSPDGWDPEAQERLRQEARQWARPLNKVKDSGLIR